MVSSPFGRGSKISPAAFTGRAVAPLAVQPDPTTTSLINQNSLQLGIVSNQLRNLTAQVSSLTGSLQVVARNLQEAQSLERQKTQQENLLESRLAEAKLREGKESAIEKKIEAKTVKPAEKLALKAQGTLGKLSSFFAALIGGWLATNTVKALRAYSEKNIDLLKELVTSVISNFTKIKGSMLLAQGAMALLGGRYKKMATFLLAGTALTMFSDPISQFLVWAAQLGGTFYQQIMSLLNAFGWGGGQRSDTPPENLTEGENNNNNNNNTNNENTLNTEGTQENNPPENIDPTTPPESIEPPNQGTGGPSLIEPTQSAVSSNQSLNSITRSLTPSPSPSVEPQNNMLDNIEMDFSQPAMYGEGTLRAESGVSGLDTASIFQKATEKSLEELGFSDTYIKDIIATENYIGKTGMIPVAEMFSSLSVDKTNRLAQTVSKSTEPAVTVAPIVVGGQQEQQPAAQQPAPQQPSGGSIGSIPSISSNNSDNIYIMSAYSIYNIIPS